MLLLATDTSGKHGSIALARCGPGENCEVLEAVPLEGGTFSAQLVPQIAALLAKHEFGKHDIGAFAIVSGPGSFTGLRVGLAAIKALAEILQKPIVTVSLLEAVGASSSGPETVLALLDAGRGEVYAGEYVKGSNARVRDERLLTRQELFEWPKSHAVVTPDQQIAAAAREAGFTVLETARPTSAVIARLGWTKILAGENIAPDELDANYIRRSDAEIFAKK